MGQPSLKFVPFKNRLLRLDQIMQIASAPPTEGRDGVVREFVVTVSEQMEPEVKFRALWATEEELEPVLAALGFVWNPEIGFIPPPKAPPKKVTRKRKA